MFPAALRPTFLGPFFGVRRSDSNATSNSSEDSNDGPCGFFCAIMRNFQAHVDQIEGEIAAARSNVTADADEGDINNSTYTEKVSVMKWDIRKHPSSTVDIG